MINITRTTVVSAAAAVTAACASLGHAGGGAGAQTATAAPAAAASKEIDLLAGGLDGLDKVGGADWTYGDGMVMATSGSATGYLFTRDSYSDFELSAEVFVSEDHNSGIYFRCEDLANLSDRTCYEANIYDDRPDQSGRTGAIPNFAPPLAKVSAAGKWSSVTVRAQGDHLIIIWDGQLTVDAHDPTHKAGPIGLQWGKGTVMFRNVKVRRL